jgi:hypothetical protein
MSDNECPVEAVFPDVRIPCRLPRGHEGGHDFNPDPEPEPGSLAEVLAQIQADHETANAFGANASDPVPRLLTALDAVLKEAGDFEADRPERLVTRSYAAECFRAAIGRALTGEEETRDH